MENNIIDFTKRKDMAEKRKKVERRVALNKASVMLLQVLEINEKHGILDDDEICVLRQIRSKCFKLKSSIKE